MLDAAAVVNGAFATAIETLMIAVQKRWYHTQTKQCNRNCNLNTYGCEHNILDSETRTQLFCLVCRPGLKPKRVCSWRVRDFIV